MSCCLMLPVPGAGCRSRLGPAAAALNVPFGDLAGLVEGRRQEGDVANSVDLVRPARHSASQAYGWNSGTSQA